MSSNVNTTRNQGGGEKKAGFPYQIGRESWTSRFIRSVEPINGNCCNQTQISKTMNFTTNTIRPIGIRTNIRMH